MKNTEKKYPVAEWFVSPQGEGLYTGAVMFYLRLAGCSVGKKMTTEERSAFAILEGKDLAVYREKCTLYDGRTFACDTDFQTSEVLTVAQILEKIPKGVERVCITGGEPLDHPLTPLLEVIAGDTEMVVHIETSGTVSITERAYPNYTWGDSLENDGGWLWITVSPKMGVLPEMIGLANEVKLLVDEKFDISKLPEDVLDHRLVYIQPINGEYDLNKENMEKCLALQREHPNWRISSQAHKLWGVR